MSVKLPLSPRQVAEEICSVQPMPTDLFKNLLALSKPRDELIAQGFKPVSSLGLMWIKDEKDGTTL